MERKNNLNTKFLPPVFMLLAGLIAYIFCLINHVELKRLLVILFVVMLVFAIIGTIIKTVVDSFNMHNSYEDFFDEGEIYEKDND